MDSLAAAEARVRVVRVLDGVAHVTVPETHYQLQLKVEDGAVVEPGPMSCVVQASALKVHPTTGGGQFIEPSAGAPRIICGLLRAIDPASRRLLVDAVIPMWIQIDETTDLSSLRIGGLVTSYLSSGATIAQA